MITFFLSSFLASEIAYCLSTSRARRLKITVLTRLFGAMRMTTTTTITAMSALAAEAPLAVAGEEATTARRQAAYRHAQPPDTIQGTRKR